MARKRTLSTRKKIAGIVGAAVLVGGIAVITTGTSNASVVCDGLDTAIRNNQNFIAAQQANPDANSAARIANRQAVIAQIEVQRKAAGCAGNTGTQPGTGAPAASASAGAQGASASAGGQAGRRRGTSSAPVRR
jgi:hypothetical protein